MKGPGVWTLTIEGKPVSQKNNKRILRTRQGRPFIASSKDTKLWAASALRQLRVQWGGRPALPAPLAAKLVVYQGKGQSMDVDNAAAAPFDALEAAGVVRNDYLIWDVRIVRKRDPERPRVEIYLWPADPASAVD